MQDRPFRFPVGRASLVAVSVPSAPCAPTTSRSGRTRRRTPSRGRGSAGGRCCSARRAAASGCSTSAAAPAASSPRCATPAPTRSASSSPRRRSRRARANAPGADLRLVEPDGSLPLDHGSVDLVWCSEVLEHVADTAHLLLEVRRVLRPGGRLLVTVPFHGRVKGAADRACCGSTRTSTRSASTCASTRAARSRDARAVGVRRVQRAAVGRAAAAAHGAHGAGAPGVGVPPPARAASRMSEVDSGACGSR